MVRHAVCICVCSFEQICKLLHDVEYLRFFTQLFNMLKCIVCSNLVVIVLCSFDLRNYVAYNELICCLVIETEVGINMHILEIR